MQICRIRLFTLGCLSIATVLSAGQQSVERAIDDTENASTWAFIAIQEEYKRSLAAALDESVEVEISSLAFDVPFTEAERKAIAGKDTFYISASGRRTLILERRLLSREEVAVLIPSLKATITGETPGVGVVKCHHPTHGLSVIVGGRPRLEMSISLYCGNFSFPYSFARGEFRNLTSPEFAELLKRFLPIPKSEGDRYLKVVWGQRNVSEEKPSGEPGATDNPDGAQRLREDH